ncbi:MAG TPA: hypothetical protein PK109_03065 [Candidatus Paceibacterota bacterium]|nr:hypothetical protein [Candidatus Paceibacterota bacterium]
MPGARLPDLRPGEPPFQVDDEDHRKLALKMVGDAIGQAEASLSGSQNPVDTQGGIRYLEQQRQAIINAAVRTA